MAASIAQVGHIPQMVHQNRRPTTSSKHRAPARHQLREGARLTRRCTTHTTAKSSIVFNVNASSKRVNAATLQQQQKQQEEQTLRLSQSKLDAISAAGKVAVPSFPRTLTPEHNVMIHLGVGGFFRSHQALYLHKLLEQGSNWAFVGMGIMDFDFKMYDALKSQDYLYTVASKGVIKDPEYTVIGSVLDFVYAPDDKQAALDRMADPQTKMVTLTITEKGYCCNSDGDLDLTNRYIADDLKDITNPVSAIGFIVAALRLRMERGQKPFTVLSCDNMPENGLVAKKMCVQLAEAADPALAAWIQQEVPFPLSMVDRITPVTSAEDVNDFAEFAGIEDAWPVVAEDFMQWVVEDNFVDGLRPAYEQADALVVEDVMPYECMKLRLLNGGHSALSYAAYLMGHREVHEAMADPRIRTFLRCYFSEVEATVPEVRGVDLREYQATLVNRFSNANIRDRVERLAQDGSAKLYNTMRDPILELLAADRPLDTVALAVALFGRYMTGVDEEGEAIIVLDPAAEKLAPLAQEMFSAGGDSESTRTFIHAVFGTEVSQSEELLCAVEQWAAIVRERGSAVALELLCKNITESSALDSCRVTYDEPELTTPMVADVPVGPKMEVSEMVVESQQTGEEER